MTGRAQVESERQRVDAAFRRALAAASDAELLADLAKYLCVLVYGFLEQAVIELLLEYVRLHSATTIQRHVEQRLRRFTTASAHNITQLLGTFDPDWQRDLELFLVDERKDAVDGVTDLRQTISHGRFTGVTLVRARNYYDRVKDVVNHIAGLCLPA